MGELCEIRQGRCVEGVVTELFHTRNLIAFNPYHSIVSVK